MNKKLFMLLGYPLPHSLSPRIHQLFARQFDLNIDYQVKEVESASLMTTIDQFINVGGSGINITAPYKELVFQQLPNHSASAMQAKAVNTIVIQPDGILLGDNTDGVGLIADFKRQKIPITAQRILICGAGGAVRGILPALLSQQPNSVTLLNRDLVKATKVAADFKNLGDVQVSSYENFSTQQVDLVINATIEGDLYSCLNFSNCYCFDLNYRQNTTTFMQYAKSKGAAFISNGLGMLVEQAAAAFELWHGKQPAVGETFQQLVNDRG